MKENLTSITFHSDLAKNWSNLYEKKSFLKRKRFFQRYLQGEVSSQEIWCDHGCGSGILIPELLKYTKHIIAVDGSMDMLSVAQSNNTFKNVIFIENNIHDLKSLTDESVDGVLSSSVLEYSNDPARVIYEITRILRKDGSLILSVSFKFSFIRNLQKIIRKTFSFFGLNLFSYLKYSISDFSSKELVQLLEDHGLKVKQLDKFDPIIPRFLFNILPASLLVLKANKLGT